MNRRDFLKLLGTFTLVGFVNIKSPEKLFSQPTATFGSTIFRAGQKGDLLQSTNGGVSWQLNASFGKDYSVQDIYTQNNLLYARLVYRGHSFLLKSTEGKTWYSSSWVSPKV